MRKILFLICALKGFLSVVAQAPFTADSITSYLQMQNQVTLKKTSGAANNWDNAYISKNWVDANKNGYVKFNITDFTGSEWEIAFITKDPGGTITKELVVSFSIVVPNASGSLCFKNGTAAVVCNSVTPANSGTANDYYMQRNGNQFYLKRGTTVIRSGTTDPTKKLYVRMAIKTLNKTINNLYTDLTFDAICAGPGYNASDDDPINGFNYTTVKTYGKEGLINGVSRKYYDEIGRSLQTQTANFAEQLVFNSQVIYDRLGRPSIQTLPAPKSTYEIGYQSNFIQYRKVCAGGAVMYRNYSYKAFDYDYRDNCDSWSPYNVVNHPEPVATDVSGTLGWYYSTNNTTEPYTPASTYPYSRTEYYNDATGRVKRITSPGDPFKMGSGKESFSVSMPGGGELESHYYKLRQHFVNNNTIDQAETKTKEYTKFIVSDQDGKQAISFIDEEGHTLATAMVKDNNLSTITNGTKVVSQASNFQDILNNTGFYVSSNQGFFTGDVFGCNIIPYYHALEYLFDPDAKVYVYESNAEFGYFKKMKEYNVSELTYSSGTYRFPYFSNDDIAYFACGGIKIFFVASDKPFTYNSQGIWKTADALSASPVNNKLIPEAGAAQGLNTVEIHVTAQTNITLTNLSGSISGLSADELKIFLYDLKGYDPEPTSSSTAQATLTASTATLSNVAPGYYKIIINNTKVPVKVSYQLKYTDWAYYYYDDAGRVVGSVAPEGIDLSNTSSPTFASRNYYNTLGQLTKSTSPDVEGATYYLYNSEGKLRFSQNPQQRETGYFSYINYDENNRVSEVGEYVGELSSYPSPLSATQLIYFASSQYPGETWKCPTPNGACSGENSVEGFLEANLTDKIYQYIQTSPYIGLWTSYKTNMPGETMYGGSGTWTQYNYVLPHSKYQTTYYAYDKPVSDNPFYHVDFPNPQTFSYTTEPSLSGYVQHNLQGRLSRTLKGHVYFNTGIEAASWFSYDYKGRVEWVIQYVKDLGYKTIDYTYDDFTGNLLTTTYQNVAATELFTHTYQYDCNNRLKDVSSSFGTDPSQHEASYVYYKHGPIKRVELGKTNNVAVQGVDYVYGINGSLKTINEPTLTPSLDPGQDGNPGPNSGVKPDVFGVQLNYYDNDYSSNKTLSSTTSPVAGFSGTVASYYNGNIALQAWKTRTSSTANTTMDVYQYTYDHHDWAKKSNFAYTTPSGQSHVINTTDQYAETGPGGSDGIQYDMNGNILSMVRNGYLNAGISSMDDLSYSYYSGTNRLRRVTDAYSNSGAYSEDLDNQTNTDNYIYNKLGQLIQNKQDNQYISYDLSGKVKKVSKPMTDGFGLPYDNTVEFFYDANGYRVKKYTKTGKIVGGHLDGYLTATTFYVNDIAGTTIAVYSSNGTEMPVYGSGRVGIMRNNGTTRTYEYEIKDQLGNVRAIVPRNYTGTTVSLLSYTNYYPFGMNMPSLGGGQAYQNHSMNPTYSRYGYQGEFAEKDPETGMNAFEMRNWDVRIARWQTADPANQYSSPYLGMGNSPMNSIDRDGAFATRLGAWIYNITHGRNGLVTGNRKEGFQVVGASLDNYYNTIYVWVAAGRKGNSYDKVPLFIDKINPIESVAFDIHREVKLDFGFIVGANASMVSGGGYINMWSFSLLDYDSDREKGKRTITGYKASRDVHGEIAVSNFEASGSYTGDEVSVSASKGLMQVEFEFEKGKLSEINIGGDFSGKIGMFFGLTADVSPSLRIKLK